jgi:UDP-N-acetylenolpyruvoylglucosamine reductase
MELPVPGRHNVLNLLAAAAVAHEIGLTADELRLGVSRLALPRRRFETAVEANGIRVISDYAHHPSEVAALMKTAAGLGASRQWVLFQPHRYTRTRALGRDFPAAFRGADRLILLPVYAASEPPLAGGTTWDLYRWFRSAAMAPLVAGNLRAAWDYVRPRLRAGDLVLIVGAGDIVEVAGWAARELPGGGWDAGQAAAELRGQLVSTELRLNEPLERRTSLKVGGPADVWAEVGTPDDLSSLLKWCHPRGLPVTILGNGTNVLAGDLGVRGVTVRLGGAFQGVQVQAQTVTAGAGLGSGKFLNILQERGLAGLEFLEGIPGTIGGMLRMNAGAWGQEILDHVLWIRCLNPDGAPCILQRNELESGYRRCDSLVGRIAVEAGFQLQAAGVADIARRREESLQRRSWMQGLRCAGSVFKNPEGDYAGRLIEQAGCKGSRIGGAFVSDRHANVIVTEPGAVAGDVRALVEGIRAAVRARFGIELELEAILL